ncbi:MAG: ABC transporter substrate-binding protein [Bacteroidetes bacterium]|nr:ABC transporter substrate-binding protein [Bacteroidota bacterium]
MTISVGGVTEHFNLPWNLAVEQNKFQEVGVDLNWKFFPGGTGVMTEALKSGELDLAILLTEGFISAAAKGLRAKIVKEYITSPLGWGIFTGAKSQFYSIYNRQPKKYAISKLGSGSHLMAMIHAEQRGEKIGAEDLIEVKSIDGAMESLSKNETQIFYWEKYTTKPFVENGMVRMIGEFSAPWSSFLIVATDAALSTKKDAIKKILEVINEESNHFISSVQSISLLQQRFMLSQADASSWLHSTVWSSDYLVRAAGLENAKQALIKIGSVNPNLKIEELCDASLKIQ